MTRDGWPTCSGSPSTSGTWPPASQRDVVDDFRAEYAAGRTPNPCLRCNEKIKFAALLDKAVALGFDAVATGHYAQVVEATDGDGGVRRELHRAVDTAKDQSYVLGVLDADQLARSFFPLGDTTKPQIREEAAERGFFIARKPDSHDICFIPDGDTRGWLTRRARGGARRHRRHAAVTSSGTTRAPSPTPSDSDVGSGSPGLLPDGEPRYVVEVRPETNQVVVGAADLLGVNAITGQHARWCGPAPEGVVRVGAQVRAHGEEHAATAWADGDRVEVRLDGRIRGVAPGTVGRALRRHAGRRVGDHRGVPPRAHPRESRSSESGTRVRPSSLSAGTGST